MIRNLKKIIKNTLSEFKYSNYGNNLQTSKRDILGFNATLSNVVKKQTPEILALRKARKIFSSSMKHKHLAEKENLLPIHLKGDSVLAYPSKPALLRPR